MEAAELVVTSVQTTDGIRLETETNQENNKYFILHQTLL